MSQSNLVSFDESEIYETKIKPLINHITTLAGANHLPFLISCCPKVEDGDPTIYTFYKNFAERFSPTLHRGATFLLNEPLTIERDHKPVIEFDYEPYYDGTLSPLILEIYDICQKHKIPFLCCVVYTYDLQKGFGNARSAIFSPYRHIPHIMAAFLWFKQSSL